MIPGQLLLVFPATMEVTHMAVVVVGTTLMVEALEGIRTKPQMMVQYNVVVENQPEGENYTNNEIININMTTSVRFFLSSEFSAHRPNTEHAFSGFLHGASWLIFDLRTIKIFLMVILKSYINFNLFAVIFNACNIKAFVIPLINSFFLAFKCLLK